MYNRFEAMGRLTETPAIKLTASGTAFAQFTLAVERDYKNAEGNRDTDFINCVAWRGTAEFLERFFVKGQLVFVAGGLEMQKYTDKDGNKRTAAVVNVKELHFTGDNRNREEKPAEYGFGQEPKNFDTAPAGFSTLDEEIPF